MPVVLVDDEAMVLTLVSKSLRNAGYPVICCQSAKDVLDRIEAGLRPSLVIIDLRMPCMDGNELIQRLQAGPAATAPKILLSAYVGDLKQELRLHLSAVIEKPVPGAQIVEAVRAAIGDPCPLGRVVGAS